jgi:deoxycytidylate deaminase
MARTELRQLIEFSRAVHAEMEAVISVGRGGKNGLLGSTLYCTTYPCHSCARHILAAGIKTVVYIEPYPKSLAMTLHYDAVSESEEDEGKKLVFLQYSGVAPKHMLRLFKVAGPRKDAQGRCIVPSKKSVTPVLAVSLDDYATHERYVVARLSQSEARRRGNAQPNLV